MPATTPVSVVDAIGKDSDAYRDLIKHVKNNVESLKQAWQPIKEQKLTKWRRLYRGIPKDAERNFPWKNASNVVIQLIGENVGILKARTLGTIWEVMPLWPTGLVGEWPKEEQAGPQQEAVHEFMNLMGMEPAELDLYRIERSACEEMYKYGTVVFKLPWVTEMEAEAVGAVEGSNKVEFKEFTKYDGPRPEKLDLDRWAATPTANTIDKADFKYHIVTLTKQQLEERFFRGVYKLSPEDKEKFLSNPDRHGPSQAEQEKAREAGTDPSTGFDCPEWDIYECWFPYFHNGRKFRIILSWHHGKELCLRAIFNFYPKNEEPWEMARFGSDDNLLGFGLCEMLEHYQEETSTGHNQRVDNRTLANSSGLRVDPDSKLDAIFAIYPNCLIPAREGEIEKIQFGTNYPSSVEEEQLTIQLAKNLVGTNDPGTQAAGGGGPRGAKGIFNSMGTFSVMQAGNRRVNINITDFRYVHLKLGRKFLNQYCEFGIGERFQRFGNRAEVLKLALQNIKRGKLELPIRAATASINKELEKQNDMLLTQVMQRHHMGVSQILQAMVNPSLPPEIKQFLVGWIDSSSIIMARILRNFGHDDISRLLPERKILEGATSGQSNQAGEVSAGANAGGAAGNPTQDPTLVQGNNPGIGANGGMGGAPGMGNVPTIPPRTM